MRRIAERAVVQEQDWQRAAPRRAPGADQVVGAEHLTAMRDALVVERPADLLVEMRERDVPQQRRVHGGLSSRSFGADKAVLVGADQSCRRTMVTVERTAVETVCDEYAVRQGV